jgi:glucose-6-phosphate dehydrogenase assembly protein OpcA
MAAAIHPDRILRDLHDLWGQMAADQADAGGVLRACAMTLVVAAEDDADAGQVRQTLGVLMHDHPSRAIVLRGGEGGVDARIFAECWKPFGSNQQICSEGIEITAGAGALDEVARFLVPLRVPDLPVVLWCRGAGALQPGRFEPLFPLADKIIFDSSQVTDARAAIDYLRLLRTKGLRVADLHWTRLTGWREALAHLFDDQALHPGEVTTARVVYGGPSVSTCALYFAAWIGCSLPAAKVTLASADGAPGLHSVTLSAAPDSLTLKRDDGGLEVQGCDRSYRALLPHASEEVSMREELGILGPDPVYERVLATRASPAP